MRMPDTRAHALVAVEGAGPIAVMLCAAAVFVVLQTWPMLVQPQARARHHSDGFLSGVHCFPLWWIHGPECAGCTLERGHANYFSRLMRRCRVATGCGSVTGRTAARGDQTLAPEACAATGHDE